MKEKNFYFGTNNIIDNTAVFLPDWVKQYTIAFNSI